ncbi:MrpF/PhaF family protein [Streptomyces xiaopingdaonensis]|uniref:MrpF/PhaF family protein n=1 Tax=Streptomyces xiaopingdaonensis TaxID=1565415 RepID=UPI0002F57C2A|nr:MrpF/PhaF family protein [Streptomyces xiaopingdaonensis]
MNGWLAAACLLLVLGLGPALCGAVVGPVRSRLLAQNVATVLAALVLLLASPGYDRPAYLDTALVLAVLGPAGTLVYERLLAEDLPRGTPWPGLARGASWASVAVVPPVVVPVCFAVAPGRTTVKVLVIGALLVAGSAVCGRALAKAPRTAAGEGSGG